MNRLKKIKISTFLEMRNNDEILPAKTSKQIENKGT